MINIKSRTFDIDSNFDQNKQNEIKLNVHSSLGQNYVSTIYTYLFVFENKK